MKLSSVSSGCRRLAKFCSEKGKLFLDFEKKIFGIKITANWANKTTIDPYEPKIPLKKKTFFSGQNWAEKHHDHSKISKIVKLRLNFDKKVCMQLRQQKR